MSRGFSVPLNKPLRQQIDTEGHGGNGDGEDWTGRQPDSRDRAGPHQFKSSLWIEKNRKSAVLEKEKNPIEAKPTKTIFGFWFPQWRSSTAISSCCYCCCLGWGKAHSLKFNDWKVRCCCSYCCCCCGGIEMHQAATLRYPLDYWLWNSSRWPGSSTGQTCKYATTADAATTTTTATTTTIGNQSADSSWSS